MKGKVWVMERESLGDGKGKFGWWKGKVWV